MVEEWGGMKKRAGRVRFRIHVVMDRGREMPARARSRGISDRNVNDSQR